MTLLIPLGLLGLLSLLILLLIYILKPNYQQKMISSTYVWKLSLKYRKKRLPVGRFRNLLILICQILILCGCAVVLAKPALVTDTTVYASEKIAIVDASASMRSSYEGSTRFERAVSMVQSLSDEVLADDGIMTVIWAGPEASFVVQRAGLEEQGELNEKLAALECSYGDADIDGAMLLAQNILHYNADAEVVLYTATEYLNRGKFVRVEDVSAEGEWNIAILDATATLENNFYTLTVEVACYGADKEFELYCEVSDANGVSDNNIRLPVTSVYCSGDKSVKVVYTVDSKNLDISSVPVILTDNEKLYSFSRIYIHVDEKDSLAHDNEFYVYGGAKPTVKIEYCSTDPYFISAFLMGLSGEMTSEWNIEVTEVSNGVPELSGYDIYIFEHNMPSALPTDGVILMIDPDSSVNAGFSVGKKIAIKDWDGDGATLAQGKEHPIIDYINVSELRLTQYTEVDESSLDGYDVLMYYEGNPVFFVKDEPQEKIAVLAFDIHNSTLPISFYFPILMANFFNYYLPSSFDSNVYEVYDTVSLNARGTGLTVTTPDNEKQIPEEFPAEIFVGIPGTYTISQTLMSGTTQTEEFYVRIPALQSNIVRVEDVLTNPAVERTTGIEYDDLVLYLAAGIVALLFLEWWLQSRGGI